MSVLPKSLRLDSSSPALPPPPPPPKKKKICFVSFNENILKMMKNAFYFVLKAFFVLKCYFKIHDITTGLTNNYNTHIAQYFTK